jgi:hypothetical protein
MQKKGITNALRSVERLTQRNRKLDKEVKMININQNRMKKKEVRELIDKDNQIVKVLKRLDKTLDQYPKTPGFKFDDYTSLYLKTNEKESGNFKVII